MSGVLPVELRRIMANRFEHVRQAFFRLEDAQPLDVTRAANRVVNHGPFTRRELERTHRLERQQDVGEEDGRVDGERLDGLQCDGERELGRPADVEQRVLLRIARYSGM